MEILCSKTGKLNIVEVSILYKLNFRFSTIPIKISKASFTGMEKPILKFTQNYKGALNSQNNLEKQE
jgi:hypothetical protein